LRAVTADFFFDCWDVEIPTNVRNIRNIPWGVHYHAQGLRLESFEDFNVGGVGRASELYVLSIILYVCLYVYKILDTRYGWEELVLNRVEMFPFFMRRQVELRLPQQAKL
jgi:hypothetical protein